MTQNPIEIAHRVGMSERTVRSWLAHESYPEPKQRRRRPSLIDPYQEYVQQQWREGLMTGPPLYQELKARGYQGSERAMYRYLETLRLPPAKTVPLQQKPLREKKRVTSPLIPPGPLESFSAHKATGLFLREVATLDEMEQQDLLLIQKASSTAQQAYLLVQAFMQMVRERTGEDLDAWLDKGQESHLPEFNRLQRAFNVTKRCACRTHPFVEQWIDRRACQSSQIDQAQHVRSCEIRSASTARTSCGLNASTVLKWCREVVAMNLARNTT